MSSGDRIRPGGPRSGSRSALLSSAILLAAILAACTEEPRASWITVGDATYRIPNSHVRSLTREPHTFVRIKPPDYAFDLVHDSRISRQLDRHGWPMIFSVNEETAPDIDRHAIGHLKIVCRRAVEPKAGCGIRMSYRGAEWDVLFPGAQLPEAPAIRERAQGALMAYHA